MKRRGFLQLFGAAVAAPLVPNIAVARSASLTAALAHARTRVSVSAWGLSQSLGVSMAQAEGLMAQMSARGAISTIQGGQGRWAVSRLYTPTLPQRIREVQDRVKAQNKSAQLAAKVDPLIAHLHRLCRAQGLVLSAGCADQRIST